MYRIQFIKKARLGMRSGNCWLTKDCTKARSSGLETSLIHPGSVEIWFLCARGGEIGSGVFNLVTADQGSRSR